MRDTYLESAGRVWTFGRPLRSAAWASIVAISTISLVGLAAVHSAAWIGAVVPVALWDLLIWRMALHPRLEITGDEVIVVNSLRTRRIHVQRIRQVGTPGYWGIPLRLDDGSTVIVSVGQKTRVASARGVRRRADDMADVLAQFVADAEHVSVEHIAPSGRQRADSKHQARVALIFGSLGLAAAIAIAILRR